MLRRLALLLLFLLAACAGGPPLVSGEATEADLYQRLGRPALTWPEAGGGQRLAWPEGPAGYRTWMAVVGPDHRLVSLENVLDAAHFARIRAGMTQDEVLKIIGPPVPAWTVYFERRDELVWEWRYCNDWSEPARFDVLFDGTTGRVRSTLAQTESLSLPREFEPRRRWCSR